MPYYLKREALAPLGSEVITRTRVERFATVVVSGFSTGETRLRFSRRAEAVDDYKGFYIPRSISFGSMRPDAPGYHLCLLEDAVDARFERRGAQKSPWMGDDTPTIEEIESHWAPLVSTDMVEDMVSIFVALEAHAIEHGYVQMGDEDKLRMVPRYEVPLEDLAAFCAILGRDTPETRSYIEDHVIFAAFNPHNYLKTQGLLAGISGYDCRQFSWRSVLRNGYFRESRYICEIDWKADAEDVAWNVNAMLNAVAPDRRPIIELSGGDESQLTDHWLQRAAIQLKRLGWNVVFIDNDADSYLFTLLEPSRTKEFIALGQRLGLKTTMLAPEDKRRPGWRDRLSRVLRLP